MLSGFTRQQLKPFLSVGKRQDLLTLAELLTTGQVTPVIDRTYPLDEAADALRYVGAGHTPGGIVAVSDDRTDENDPTVRMHAQTCRQLQRDRSSRRKNR